MRAITQLYTFLMYFLLIVFTCAEEKNESVFVPSREWQTIEKGTPIPAGLHVRHNFQTGITEAKLMDDDETKEKDFNENANLSHLKSLILHPDKELLESEDDESVKSTEESKSLKFPIKELKARLKKIKAQETDFSSDDESRQKKVMQKFRSYEELKKKLKDVEGKFTTDAEVLTTLFKKFETYKKAISTTTLNMTQVENVLDILNNLEYLIHQIDNAHLFAEMEGINNIVLPCLNSTNHEVKAEALRLVGTAVQSNPKVQAKALDSGLLQELLHILLTSNLTMIKSRCLFALSALVRQFPIAQRVMIKHGGIEIFVKILSSNKFHTQIKVMKLINDLVIERQDLDKISDIKQRKAKAEEYANTIFESYLIMHRYCFQLNDLMIKNFLYEVNNHNMDNYELLEVISESMITCSPICKGALQTDKNLLLPAINTMLNFCLNLSSNSNSDDSETINNQLQLLMKLKTIVMRIPSREEL